MGACVFRNLGGSDAAVVEGPPEPQRPDASVVDLSEEEGPALATTPYSTCSCTVAAPPAAAVVVVSVGLAAAVLLGRRRRR